jgi:alpha-L-arabinofuranosidase
VDSPEVSPAVKSGAVGVGTWRTEAEFKDMKVVRDGETLFTCDFADGTKGWRLRGGNWSVADGALRQGSLAENVRAFVGDKGWNNYTYTLKARKLGGEEGFLIPFLVQDEQVKAWWNIGGWGNQRHAVEMDGIIGDGVPGRIETGRWYDIRIDVSQANIKCYLDGKLIHDLKYPVSKSLYAVASRGRNGREAILKVVNVSRVAQDTEINLRGAKPIRYAQATVLASDQPEDENSLEQPTKVVPITRTLSCAGTQLRHTFPPNSVTVLRLQF